MPFDPFASANTQFLLDDGHPDDWFVPQGDDYPDDWVPVSSAAPNNPQGRLDPQLKASAPGSPTPPDPLAAYWSRVPADRLRAVAWAPSIVPDTPTADSRPFAAPRSLFGPPMLGLFGGPISWWPRADASEDPLALPNWTVNQSGGPADLIPVAGKQRDPLTLDLFDERAFGNTPPLGSAAPRLIPPLGNSGPRPSPRSSPTQAPSRLTAPPVQSIPAGTTGVAGAQSAQALGSPKSGSVGGFVAPAPAGAVAPPPDVDWRKLVENIERIRDARAEGGAKLSAAISAALPKYDGTTAGILVTNEGDVVPLQSGAPDPLYKNYVSARHAEGKAAIWIREHGSTGGIVYHNNTEGTCGFCTSQAETLLPKSADFRIIPPADAIPKNDWATATPTDHVGNGNPLKRPAQGDFLVRQP